MFVPATPLMLSPQTVILKLGFCSILSQHMGAVYVIFDIFNLFLSSLMFFFCSSVQNLFHAIHSHIVEDKVVMVRAVIRR